MQGNELLSVATALAPHFPTRQQVIDEALTWIGTPFHEGVHIKGVGVSCGQLLIAVYGSLGFTVPREVGHFPIDWALHTREERYLDILSQFTREIGQQEIMPADIALYRVGRVFCHSAIIVDWPSCLIHAYDGGCHRVELVDGSKQPLASRKVRFFTPFPK